MEPATDQRSRNVGNETLHTIDFQNFGYFWQPPEEWPNRLQWLVPSGRKIQLKNGRWQNLDETPRWTGLTLESVDYGDLTGDSKDEAVVVLRYNSGGSQYHYYVYIFSAGSRSPKLLAYFRSGDRANFGLYRIAIDKKSLVVDLYDPKGQQGDCCSTLFRRNRYSWRNHHFEVSSPIEFGVPQTTSRQAVNVLGLPQ